MQVTHEPTLHQHRGNPGLFLGDRGLGNCDWSVKEPEIGRSSWPWPPCLELSTIRARQSPILSSIIFSPELKVAYVFFF